MAVSDLPRVEHRMRTKGTEEIPHKRYLSPQQSAVVLRERYLKFLEGHDVAVHGVVCVGHARARAVAPAFYDAVAQDMDDSGIPLLARVTPPHRTVPRRPERRVPTTAPARPTTTRPRRS
ncbi:hypothetical protein [Streptomyces sp. NPDC012825]|uniref:hypothetical protein n=1 Tax=Streptomyces sp. NPDC012825 TaxID=3364851 RepID=UPI003673A754